MPYKNDSCVRFIPFLILCDQYLVREMYFEVHRSSFGYYASEGWSFLVYYDEFSIEIWHDAKGGYLHACKTTFGNPDCHNKEYIFQRNNVPFEINSDFRDFFEIIQKHVISCHGKADQE